MNQTIREDFFVFSRPSLLGICCISRTAYTRAFKDTRSLISELDAPEFCWEFKKLGLLREHQMDILAMLYPKFMTGEALEDAYKIAIRDGIAVIEVSSGNPYWR